MANRGGRPTSYREEYVSQAEKLCRIHAATDFELCLFFGINPDTLYQWKLKHPAFAEALKLGKEVADARVEKSLYQKAVGYSMESVKILVLKEMTVVTEKDTGKEISRSYREVVHHEPYIKHFPPDTTSCIFWLKNRQPDEWRDVKAVEHDIGKRLSGLAESQIESRIAELCRKAGTPRVIDGEATPG